MRAGTLEAGDSSPTGKQGNKYLSLLPSSNVLLVPFIDPTQTGAKVKGGAGRYSPQRSAVWRTKRDDGRLRVLGVRG